jgi:hypothetical protein
MSGLKESDIGSREMTMFIRSRIAKAGGELELSAQISTKSLSKLSSGLTVKRKVVKIGELPGRVRFVSKTVDSTTQLGEVRVSISFDERLKAGMFGRAIINSGQRYDRVAVPLSALLYGEGSPLCKWSATRELNPELSQPVCSPKEMSRSAKVSGIWSLHARGHSCGTEIE